MLAKFKVSNFKSFNKDFSFDLTETNGYSFNQDCIKNEIVNAALVYGHNGVGKSNLGLAIFDILEHLTDTNKNESEYHNYLNAYNDSTEAEFFYEFSISGRTVQYIYRKTDYKTLSYESFKIDGVEYAHIDRSESGSAMIRFAGAQNLKSDIKNPELSILKYVRSNSILDEDAVNITFLEFFKFIDGMLFFRALQKNQYLGIELGNINVVQFFAEQEDLKGFEEFLNKAGIVCKLAVVDGLEKKTLAFDFDGKYLPFGVVASQGTKSLMLFYYWFRMIREKKISFIFIDEFDAFYHHELSALIVQELIKSGVQFILTTHNISIITNDLLRPDCYFLINKDNIRSLSKSTNKELREAHNIEKMYKAGSFYGQ